MKDNGSDGIAILVLITVCIYLIPALVAFLRRHPNRWPILLLNIFLGGTGIVWFACLIWAAKAIHIRNDRLGTNGGESGLNLVANDIKRVRIDDLPPQPAAPSMPFHDPIEQLERLKRLFDTHVIDREQFEAMRKKIIASSE